MVEVFEEKNFFLVQTSNGAVRLRRQCRVRGVAVCPVCGDSVVPGTGDVCGRCWGKSEFEVRREWDAVGPGPTGGGGRYAGRPGLSTKGRDVKEFSRRSRTNLRLAMAAFPWEEAGARLALITLTYPEVFPMDGKVVRRHVKRFRERWRRAWGNPIGVWIREFQDRGAPHMHLYVGLPVSCSMEEFEAWGSQAWYESVGSGDSRHRRWGFDVRPVAFGSVEQNVQRVCDYFWRESGKYGQKKPPEGFENLGCYWGCWGAKPHWETVGIPAREWFEIRRVLLALRQRRAVHGKFASPRPADGMWLLSCDARLLVARLLPWATEVLSWKGVGG